MSSWSWRLPPLISTGCTLYYFTFFDVVEIQANKAVRVRLPLIAERHFDISESWLWEVVLV